MKADTKNIKFVNYWGLYPEPNTDGVPGGRIGATDCRCSNPDCDTGCPAVSVIVTLEIDRIDIRMDIADAEALAAEILESARKARGASVN